MTAGWELVTALLRDDPARPRLVHYDLSPGGMRIELGGKALANWVAKVANLLLDECDAEPDDAVVLDLPPVHWRTAVWVLGCWAAGARPCPAPPPGGARTALALSAAGHTFPAVEADVRGVLDLAPLARGVGDLPPGALDLNSAVQSQPDTLLAPPVTTTLPAGVAPAGPLTAAQVPDLGTLGALLVGGLPQARPVVLVSGLPATDDGEALARITRDERLS